SPLIVAIMYCPSAIELLLASGVDINEETRFGPPLLAAARYQWLYPGARRILERENAVKILLEKGADPKTLDKDGRNALMVMSMEYRFLDRFVVRRGLRRPPAALAELVKLRNIGTVRGALDGRPDIYSEAETDRALQLIG